MMCGLQPLVCCKPRRCWESPAPISSRRLQPERPASTSVSRRRSQLPSANTSAIAANLSLFWELDFWGKFRRATEAARANLLATEWGQRAVMTSLVSNVATVLFPIARTGSGDGNFKTNTRHAPGIVAAGQSPRAGRRHLDDGCSPVRTIGLFRCSFHSRSGAAD